MEDVKRYRMWPHKYLCLTPEEALLTGVNVDEDMVEVFLLTRSHEGRYKLHASVRAISYDVLIDTPIMERKEKLFEDREEAVAYIKANNSDGTLFLYGVKEHEEIPRSRIYEEESDSVESFLEQIKGFE